MLYILYLKVHFRRNQETAIIEKDRSWRCFFVCYLCQIRMVHHYHFLWQSLDYETRETASGCSAALNVNRQWSQNQTKTSIKWTDNTPSVRHVK